MNFNYRKMYINGQLCDAISGARKSVICPGTEEQIAEIAWAGKKDAELALNGAKKGFEYWSKLPLTERTRWMMKLREAIIKKEEFLREAIMYEMGKPYPETAEDYQIIDALQFYPEAMKFRMGKIITDAEGTHRHKIIEQPAGVVVAYLPWNFPLLCVGFKLGPALAAGCSIIIKPSSFSPLSAYLIGEICHEIDFPEGVINILCGPSDEVAATLSSSNIPKVITMIASSQVARKVINQSATSIKRYSLELGGNAPAIVFPDAGIEQAATDVATLKFSNCGQICVTPNRVFVHKDVLDKFIDLLVKKAKEVKIGFGREENPTMGPVISRPDLERIDKMVKTAQKEGAELVFGGEYAKNFSKGFFYTPTILKNVRQGMEIFRHEIFGPVVSIIAFETEQEVIKMANDTEYGLASYLYTQDINVIQRLSESLNFGEVMVNGFKWSVYLPHMGINESGVEADCSYMALDPYLVKKRITIKYN